MKYFWRFVWLILNLASFGWAERVVIRATVAKMLVLSNTERFAKMSDNEVAQTILLTVWAMDSNNVRAGNAIKHLQKREPQPEAQE